MSAIGTIVCHVISSGKVVFCTQTRIAHDSAMLAQIKDDSFNHGQPLPYDATGLADIAVKWTSLLMTSWFSGSDTVILDGGGAVTGITEVIPTPPTPGDYLLFKNGSNELADGAEVEFEHDSAKVLTIRKKDGQTNADKTGTETVDVEAQATLLVIDASEVVLSAGSASVTIGPQPANQRGCMMLEARDRAGVLRSRRVKLRLT
jgi:hypothetical protein